MDEVDGMSAGDRGGVTALIALIKKTKVICSLSLICCNTEPSIVGSDHLYSQR